MVWKTIPGYPGYSANSEGHIRNEKTGHVSKGGNAGEYLKVSVYAKGAKKPSLCYVHDLVCRAFHGLPSKGQVVLHKDDNKKNCKPSNLKWGSQSENIKSAYDNGLISKEAKEPRSLIVPKDIRIVVIIGSQEASVVNPYIDVVNHLKGLGVSDIKTIVTDGGPVSEADLYITHGRNIVRCQGGVVFDLGQIDKSGYTVDNRIRVEQLIKDIRFEVNGFVPQVPKLLSGW